MKKKIIFIVGHGHSGSSIVGRILSSVDGGLNVGEMGQLHNYLSNKAKCYCGEELTKCKFWSTFLNSIDTSLLNINTRHLIYNKSLRSRIEENEKLFRLMFSNDDEISTIIDSNKNIVRAALLANKLRNSYDVELIKTHRSFFSLLKSYKKRHKNKNAGRIAKNPIMLFLTYPYFQLLSVITNFYCKLNKIKFLKIKNIKKNLLSPLNFKLYGLDLVEVNDNEFKILEKKNHSVGGSSSSKRTNLKL